MDPQRNARDDDDEVIDLEPTLQYEPGIGASQNVEFSGVPIHDRSVHMNLVAGSGMSLNSETADLLRSRLMLAALFIAATCVVLSILALFNHTSALGPTLPSCLVRLILSAGLAALLASRIPLSYRALRGLEYGYFGLFVLIHMATQYIVINRLIEADDMVRLISVEKNGVLNMIILMLMYGIFIPNRPAVTARTVLTMALGPMLVLAAVAETRSTKLAAVNQLASNHAAINNIVFIFIGAALAIYSAYVLNGLRTDLRSARKLGQYQLGEKLGEGGMGEVYLAEHQLLKRPCALKLIKPDINTNVLALARFEREVQSSAMLSHPNSISIYDYGHTPDGTFYYVMEHLPGMSVADLVKQFGPVSPGRAVYIIRQVCGALAEAHNLGLVHRDLKPANIFIAILGGKFDVAKVLDYGLVKLTDDKATQLTTDYTVSGTPLYMSPEQATATAALDAARAAAEKEHITWPNWLDGDSGPILSSYHVRGFPSSFLLDAQGVIRQRDTLPELLGDRIEQLVKQAEEAPKQP